MTIDNTYKPVAQPPRMGAFDEHDQNLIRYLGLNPNKPEDRAAVAVCRHYGLDPLLKHVVVIPRSGVYLTRDGLLNIAHRSGQLDGIVVDQEPTLDTERNEWVARVSVYRKDMGHPFTYPGRYPANGGNKVYAPEMALKAAESHALRRAFEVTALPTLDEQRAPEQQRAEPGDRYEPVAGQGGGNDWKNEDPERRERVREHRARETEAAEPSSGAADGADSSDQVDRSDEYVDLFQAEADEE